MANEFKCPSCSAPMTFSGGDSIFQTCQKCHAPIVIPTDVYYSNSQKIASVDFATLANDKPVSTEQVSLDVGAGEVANDDKIEKILSSPDNDDFAPQTSEVNSSSENIEPSAPQTIRKTGQKEPSEAQLTQLNYLVNQGRKIEAIRFYRGIYGGELETAKTEVEEMLEKSAANPAHMRKKAAGLSGSAQSILYRIRNELENGNKVNAIKIFHESFNTGLAESKEVIDAMHSGRDVDISGFTRR